MTRPSVSAPANGTSNTVLERLGEVRNTDLLGAGQVGDRAGQLEHAMIATRR